MKRQSVIITLSFALSLSFVFSYSFIFTKIAAPPDGSTGSPAVNGTTCAQSGCHDDNNAQVDQNNLISLSIGQGQPTQGLNGFKYDPNTTYNISINLNNLNSISGTNRTGFQISALNDNNQQAGTFARTNMNRTSLSTTNGIQYLGHKNVAQGNNPAWVFEWTSPASGEGPVVFYVAANAANGNNANTGDQILTTQKIACETGTGACQFTGIFSLSRNQADIALYPNPVDDQFTINFNSDPNKALQVQLLNSNGERVSTLYQGRTNHTNMEKTFHLESSLSNGLYFVEVVQGEKRSYKKLLKQ